MRYRANINGKEVEAFAECSMQQSSTGLRYAVPAILVWRVDTQATTWLSMDNGKANAADAIADADLFLESLGFEKVTE